MLASRFQNLSDLAKAILKISNRGENYDGQNSTYITDWLEEGQGNYDDMTVEELAAEWDE